MEAEVLSRYKSIKVVPGASKLIGEMDEYSDTIGFHLTAFTAEMFADGESSTFITDAERVKVVKKAPEVWVAGETVYWLEATSNFTNVAGTVSKKVGKVVQGALSAAVIGYIMFYDGSPIQRDLSLGTVAVPLNIIADDPMLGVHVTSTLITGMINAADITLVMTAEATVNTIEAFRVTLTSDVKLGNWANVIFAKLDLQTSGEVAGLASAFCAELTFPSTDAPSGGSYQALETEINCPSGCDMNGRPIAVVGINSWGANKTQFDDVGLMFDITGVTSGDTKFVEIATVGNIDAFIKCRINGTFYYLRLSADTAA